MFVQGHASNSITRIPESLPALAKLDLLVIADPHPTTWASLSVEAGRKDGTYLLPVCTQFESSGSRVASNRSIQWGEQIVKPIFECKDDYQVIYLMANKLGFADKMFKNIKVEDDRPVPEDMLREINRGSWSTGYCGQSPERLKLHMANQGDFDLVTMRAEATARARAIIMDCRGRAGAAPSSSIQVRRFFTTQTSMSWTAAARSVRVLASSATASTCSRKAHIPRTPRSRTAIPNSPLRC